jgi:hypothetical protein
VNKVASSKWLPAIKSNINTPYIIHRPFNDRTLPLPSALYPPICKTRGKNAAAIKSSRSFKSIEHKQMKDKQKNDLERLLIGGVSTDIHLTRY